MSAEDQSDDEHAICPYCEHQHRVESEDYNESGTDQQCDSCKKHFHYVTDFTVTHRTWGDCALNNEEHDYHEYKRNASVLVCSKCDKNLIKGGIA